MNLRDNLKYKHAGNEYYNTATMPAKPKKQKQAMPKPKKQRKKSSLLACLLLLSILGKGLAKSISRYIIFKQ